MKREILFKAKRIDNGEWVEGDLARWLDGSYSYMMEECFFGTRDLGDEDENGMPDISSGFMALGGFVRIDPETVCQFTGLLDKNGVKIFEGDKGEFLTRNHKVLVTCSVEWHSGDSGFNFKDLSCNGLMGMAGLGLTHNFQVTGNIHDK